MKIAVLGSGTWATTLASILADNQHDVTMWVRSESASLEINQKHTNSKYLKDLQLNPLIKASSDIEDTIKDVSVIVIAIPTAYIRDLLVTIEPLITGPVTIVNASKGFDPKTDERISELIKEIIPSLKRKPVVSLIGPGHAEETIRKQLTTICSVSIDDKEAKKIQEIFSNEYLRVYTLNDEIGAEYGVALKNVIAVASGVLAGLGYGDNARAALMTRGLAEMVRYGMSKGGRLETYLGLTGIGDLIVTCSSAHSRNFQAGYQIGLADSAQTFLANNTKTVEGIRSTEVFYKDAQKNHIDMPIVEAIYQVLYEGEKPSSVIKKLMERPLKSEL